MDVEMLQWTYKELLEDGTSDTNFNSVKVWYKGRMGKIVGLDQNLFKHWTI